MGARFAENISYYIITAFILVYLVAQYETDKLVRR